MIKHRKFWRRKALTIDKKTLVLAVVISWVLTLVTVVLINNFAPNLFQPSVQDQSETTDNDLLMMASGSMEPTIKLGDYVRIDRQINIEDIHAAPADANPPGDILAYQGARYLIVHRAIDKWIEDGRYIFIMHGDANPVNADEKVSEDKIVGKVVEIIPSSEK